jgi:hypothetical protein
VEAAGIDGSAPVNSRNQRTEVHDRPSGPARYPISRPLPRLQRHSSLEANAVIPASNTRGDASQSANLSAN